jgi:hypothetical protein
MLRGWLSLHIQHRWRQRGPSPTRPGVLRLPRLVSHDENSDVSWHRPVQRQIAARHQESSTEGNHSVGLYIAITQCWKSRSGQEPFRLDSLNFLFSLPRVDTSTPRLHSWSKAHRYCELASIHFFLYHIRFAFSLLIFFCN